VRYKLNLYVISRPPLWSSDQSSWLQNGDVLCFLWGRNLICIWYVEESRPPLWASGQRLWLQNGDVLWFLWGKNWISICFVEECRLPLWSSLQSSSLQTGDVLCFLWGTKWIYICYVRFRHKEDGTPHAKIHWSQRRLCRKIGESLSFPKLYYSMPINMFFIVKNHWQPYFTDNSRRRK
jgi:hypothetical protein